MALDPLIPPDPAQAASAPVRALPFSSLLADVMNEAQERDMTEDALKRIDDLKAASGWTAHDTDHPDEKTFFGVREIAEKKFEGNLEFRRKRDHSGQPTIFESSNVSLNTVKHQVRDLVASVCNNTVGTKPFFTTMPEGDLPETDDAPGSTPQTAVSGPSPLKLSKLVEMFADAKIDASNCEDALRQGLQTTCIKGEQIYKISHRFDATHSRDKDIVLCGPDGQPVYDGQGQAIYQDDIQKDANGQPALDPFGAMVPVDPSVQIPPGAQFALTVFDKTSINYRGPDISPVHYKSWLCPLNVARIEDGTNVFMYDLPVEEVARIYRHPKFIEKNGRSPVGAEAMAILRDLETETSAPKTPVSQPSADRGEQSGSANDENRKVLQIAEFYDRRDVDGDGLAEEFILVLDIKNRRALYYNYLDQVFPSGERPFKATTLGKVANRWFGSGLFEQFDRQELFIDTQFNRANYRNSAAGRIDGYDPEGTEETAAGDQMSFGTGVPYKLRPGKKLSDVFQSVTMPALTEDILAMKDQMVQSVQTEGANIGADDASTSGLNSSKTAYGIRNIEQNKDSLQGYYEDEMQVGVLDVMQAAVECVFFHMDDVEEFSYTEKDKAVFRTITRQQVRDLKYKVSLSLLQKNTQQNLQNIQLAVTLGKDYLALPKNLQKALRSLYIQQAKILKIQEAETTFPDPDTLPDPAPPPTPLSDVAAIMTALAALAKAGIALAPNDISAIIVQAGLPAPQGPMSITPQPQPGQGGAGLPSLPPITPPPTIAPTPVQLPQQPQLANAA